MGDVLFQLDSRVSSMFDAGIRSTLAQRRLYQLFDLCLIKHVLTVWPLPLTLSCLVTKQCLMVFGRQTFPVRPGPYSAIDLSRPDIYFSVLQFFCNEQG